MKAFLGVRGHHERKNANACNQTGDITAENPRRSSVH
jgi:hypothetical protein